MAQRQDKAKARDLVVSESMSGNHRSVVCREPDRFGFGDEVTHGEHESVGPDDRSVANALGPQDGRGERLVRNFCMHQDDRLQRGFQVEAQLVRLRLQARGKGPVAGFSHNGPILRTGAGGTHLQALGGSRLR